MPTMNQPVHNQVSQESLAKEDYDVFRQFLEDACGIVLGENKHYLVTSRLTRLCNDFSFTSLKDMLDNLKQGANNALKQSIIDAMTTNETSWFRDAYPFTILHESLFVELAKARKNPMRIWSSASSSGQEAYSISMTFSEFMKKNPGMYTGNLEVVGTDISPSMVKLASQAKYDELSLGRGLSSERLNNFFIDNHDGGRTVKPEIKNRCRFTELNLLNNYTLLGKFDIIFCRNVLIYFSPEIKSDILTRMAQALNPGGFLILGGSESPTGYCDAFQMQRFPAGVIYSLK